MNKKELILLINEKEKQVESARLKRSIITILAYAAAIFLLFYLTEKPTGIDVLGDALASIILSGILFLINGTVFRQLYSMSEAENKMLQDLKKRLSELENTKN
jgi:hypothetical protein